MVTVAHSGAWTQLSIGTQDHLLISLDDVVSHLMFGGATIMVMVKSEVQYKLDGSNVPVAGYTNDLVGEGGQLNGLFLLMLLLL